MDDLSELEISGAEIAGVSSLMLALGLEPEEIPLRTRRELQHENAAIRARLLVRGEAAIRGDHHQVELRLCEWSRSRAPAEVDQFIFGV